MARAWTFERGRESSFWVLLSVALLITWVSASAGPPQPAQGSLDVHFVKNDIEEGLWSSENPALQNLNPLSGAFDIYAIYSVPVDSLVLFIDDLQVDVHAGSEAHFLWDTKGWPDGTHEIKVQVIYGPDQPGPVFSFSIETKTEKEASPPEVAIASPQNLSVVRGIVTVTAEAHGDHDIAKLWLLVDGVKLGEGSNPPHDFSWDTLALPNGSEHKLEARATDTSGKEGVSSPVTVSVSNPVPLLKNSRIEGTPPLPWKASEGLVLERKSEEALGAYSRLTALPSFASGALEQEFTLATPAADAVVSLKHRWGISSAAPKENPGACKVELLGGDGTAVFSWACPGETSDAHVWTESSLALPALQPGRYTLRLTVQGPSGASPHFDVSQADVVMP